jgi:hypothetical protein
MSNYRPITDFWLLGRAKRANGIKRYGAYLGGFPERARKLLGVSVNVPVLHACGGLARFYPYRGGFGPNDKTLDLDPAVSPDFEQDAREPWPMLEGRPWSAILIDPPYSEKDAEKYPPGAGKYPTPHQLLTRAVEVLAPGARVGIIHYLWPQPVKGLVQKEVAAVCVTTGRNARARHFVVFEKELAA